VTATARKPGDLSGSSNPLRPENRRAAWWMMAVFFAAAVLSYTDRFILSLLVDPIRAELNITDTQVSLLQGLAFALIYAFAGLPLGRVADLYPRKLVIASGILLWTAATLACGLSQSFGQLFLARLVVGIGEAALAPAAVSMIADAFPENRRGTAIGIFLAGMAIGGGAALAIGGAMLEAANEGLLRALPLAGALSPWRQVLVLLVIPGVALVLLVLTVREPARRAREELAGQPMSVAGLISALRSKAHILAPLYLAVALVSAGDMSFQTWTPALLSRRFLLTPGEIGTHLGTLAIATGVLGTLAGGALADFQSQKAGESSRPLLACGLVLSGLMGASIGMAQSAGQAMVCFVVWTLSASMAEAVIITALQAAIPDSIRGVGTALTSLGNMLIGLSAGTTLTAILTDRVFNDPRAVGLSMTCVLVPSALAAILLLRRARARMVAGST
jgi:MFS family permease